MFILFFEQLFVRLTNVTRLPLWVLLALECNSYMEVQQLLVWYKKNDGEMMKKNDGTNERVK